MNKQSLAPIPAWIAGDWAEPFPIETAVRTKRHRWICRGNTGGQPACGHKWIGTISARLYRKTGCRRCMYVVRSRPIPDRLRQEWAGPRDIDKATYTRKHWWQCPAGHRWRATLTYRLNKASGGCPKCPRPEAMPHRRTVDIPAWVRADWDVPTPIDEANRRKAGRRFVHRVADASGKPPCGRSWTTSITARISNKNGCPHCSPRGRPRITPERVELARQLLLAGEPVCAVVKACKTSPSTIKALRAAGVLPVPLNERTRLRAAASSIGSVVKGG